MKGEAQWKAYQERFNYDKEGGEKPNLNIMDEANAIACELEVLNLLLNDELANTVIGNGKLDIKGIRSRLKASRPDQIGPLNFNLEASVFYFKGSRKYMGFPKAFLDYIASAAVKNGFHPVVPNSSGGLQPY